MLDEHLGRNWRTDLSLLNELQQHCDFPMVNHAVHQAKLENKKRLERVEGWILHLLIKEAAIYLYNLKVSFHQTNYIRVSCAKVIEP